MESPHLREAPLTPKSPKMQRNLSERLPATRTLQQPSNEPQLREEPVLRSKKRIQTRAVTLSTPQTGLSPLKVSSSESPTKSPKSRRRSFRFLSRSTSIQSLRNQIAQQEKEKEEEPVNELVTFKSISVLSPRTLEQQKKERLMEKLKGKLILAETETEDERAARQKKATSTINELTETEEAYLKDLDVMIEKIMKPMAEKKDFLTGKPLVSPEEVVKIWSNIELLPKVNITLLQGLKEIDPDSGDDRQSKVADTFQSVADYMKIYTVFCSNQSESTATVQGLLKSSQFEAFLAEKADVSVMAESRNLDLNAFLIKPVQRICKYPLFLRDLLNVTPFDHPSYIKLSDAAEKVDAVVLSINENKKKAENNMRLADVAAKIGNCPIPIMIPGRKILFYGEVKKVQVQNKKSMKGTVFLFSDIILIAKAPSSVSRKKGKSKYIFHGNVKFLSFTVTSEKDGHKIQSTGRVPFTLYFDSLEILDNWVDNLHAAIKHQRSKSAQRHMTS